MVVENVGADLLQLTVFRRGGYLDDPTGPLFLSTRSSLLGEFFGQDIEVGDPQFDRLFVVRSNDAGRTQRLLANAKIRDLIQAQPSITVNLQPEEVGPCVLSLEDRETLGDLVLLRAWYALLDEILTELFRKV
jgi:hypothetical protein